MTSNTLSYSDIPTEKLSQATSLGGVLQQISVSFGISVGAMLPVLSWNRARVSGDMSSVTLTCTPSSGRSKKPGMARRGITASETTD